MIEARFGLKRRPFDKSIDTARPLPLARARGASRPARDGQSMPAASCSSPASPARARPWPSAASSTRSTPSTTCASTCPWPPSPSSTPTPSSTAPWAAGGPLQEPLFEEIQHGVAQLAARGKQPVIILDEADLLRSPLFDELRILLNFEMDSKDPLLLILAGQPQLLAKLALRVHLPFRQRVAMRYRMPTMDEQHTRGYVEHQLRLAGRQQRLFTDEALMQIFVQSGGIPRVIGNLALAAMYRRGTGRQGPRRTRRRHHRQQGGDVMAQINPEEWSIDQRAAVAADLDQQLLDVIERLVRLGRDLVAETSVAEYLVIRKIRLEEDELPF